MIWKCFEYSNLYLDMKEKKNGIIHRSGNVKLIKRVSVGKSQVTASTEKNNKQTIEGTIKTAIKQARTPDIQ